MATCDHPSDLVHRSAYLPLERAGVQTDSRFPGFLSEREKRPSASTRLQGIEAGEVFHSLIATGGLPTAKSAMLGMFSRILELAWAYMLPVVWLRSLS
jgi:hypothetical protein